MYKVAKSCGLALLSVSLLSSRALAQSQAPAQPASPVQAQQPATLPTPPAASAPAASTTAPAVKAPPTVQAPAKIQPPVPPVAPEPPKDPRAVLLWSAVLDRDAPAILPTEIGVAALRSAAIAGDRVVALFASGSELSHGGRPIQKYRLVSLDLKSGEVKAQKDIQGQSFPQLFVADDDRIVLGHTSLTRLNPDLSESAERFTESGKGRILCISADGTTLARFENGTQMLNARTLAPTGVRIKGPEPAAATKNALLTADRSWASQFPQDLTFVAMLDQWRPHLLYRGKCGGKPAYLSESKLLFVGCGKATVLDTSGRLLKEIPLGAAYGAFAGVSRDGTRFALESSDYSIADRSYNSEELFTLYNSETYEPVATVRPDTLPEARSWSALSPDGHLFLSGGPSKLTLYRIP